jgi:hypothetical protein
MVDIPKLQRQIAITQPNGTPTPTFQQWWQTVAQNIEGSINDLVSVLERLGLVEVTADGALELADSAINPDGTIKTSKVLTSSIIPNGVTQGSFVQSTLVVNCPDGVETDLLSLAITKDLDESDIELSSNLRFQSSDDIIGTFRYYRDATLLDSVQFDMRTNGGVQKNVIAYDFVDDFAVAGPYTYKITFTRSGGASSVQMNTGSSLRPREFLR